MGLIREVRSMHKVIIAKKTRRSHWLAGKEASAPLRMEIN